MAGLSYACGPDSAALDPPSPVITSVVDCDGRYQSNGVVPISVQEDGWWLATMMTPDGPYVVESITYWSAWIAPERLGPGDFLTDPGRAHRVRLFVSDALTPPAIPDIIAELHVPQIEVEQPRRVTLLGFSPISVDAGQSLGVMLPLVFDASARRVVALGACGPVRATQVFESRGRSAPYSWTSLASIGVDRVPFIALSGSRP